jgi:WD40 repeat protein/DNA-directed RNA polymerase subunit K/omega
MNTRPLILLAFANDQSNYLHQIGREMENLREQLTPIALDRGFELEPFPYTDSHKLVEYLNDNQQRLVLLHFAGHSNSDILQLDDGELHIRGLAEKLGACPHLQLVVLNGCQNAAQVHALRAAKVPAVIGTNAPIGDQTATEFTQTFYLALAKRGLSVADAFTQAKQDVETSKGQSFRSLDIHTPDTGQVWAWFLDPPQVSWKLLDAADPCNRLPPLTNVKLPTDDNPFRSLRYYRERHAKLFFGRCPELLETINLLDNMSADILLIHSATGIGKTSFLMAGLVPHLKARQQTVEYWRYNELDHKQDIREQIFGSADPTAVSIRLHQPSPEGLPAIWIIDQVEDAFLTAESLDNSSPFPAPLIKLLKTLHAIFNPPAGIKPPHVKVVMALRKEWFAELVGACQKYAVNQINYPLKPLDKSAIIKIVCSLAEAPELQQAYRLRIKPSGIELANQIADDLLIDKQSSIAPTLQIILYRLWEKVKNDDDRVWTKTLYETETHGGLLLDTYVDQQLDEIAKQKSWGVEAKDSGLLLDVLFAHATQQGTTQNLDAADYEKRYSHIPYRRDLLDTLKKHFLLVDTYTNKANAPSTETRLIHDTLAQLIENKYDASMLPGQKARRILNGRKSVWKKEGNGKYVGPALDRYDLQLVEEGQKGTSDWQGDSCETAIIHKSRQHRKNREIRDASAIFVLIATFLAAIVFAILAENRAVTATIYNLLANAQMIVANQNDDNGYADRALLLTLHAAQLDTGQAYTSDIYKTMSQVLHDPETGTLPYSPQAKFHCLIEDELWAFSPDGILQIWDMRTGRQTQKMQPPALKKHFPTACAFDKREKELATFDSKNQTLLFWDHTKYQPYSTLLSVPAVFTENMYFSSPGLFTWDNNDQVVRFWDNEGQPLGKDKHPTLWTGEEASFSPDGKMITINKASGKLRFWDTDYEPLTQKPVESGQTISKIRFTPSGQLVTVDQGKGTLRYWDSNGKLTGEGSFPAGSNDNIAFSPSGAWAMVNYAENTLNFGDRDGRLINPEPIPTGQTHVSFIQFSTSGYLVSKDFNTGTLRFWDSYGRTVGDDPPPAIAPPVDDMALSHRGALLAWNNKKRELYLWDKQDAPSNKQPIFTEQIIDNIVFSRKDSFASVDQENRTLRFWNPEGKPLNKAPIPTGQQISTMKFLDNDLLVTADFNTGAICFWHSPFLTPNCQGQAQTGQHVTAIKVSGKSGNLVTVDQEKGTLRFWKNEGQPLSVMIPTRQFIGDVAFSQTTGELVTVDAQNGSLRFWDNRGNLLNKSPIQTGEINAALIALPDGQIVIWSETKHDFRVWDAKKGLSACIAPYSGHGLTIWDKQVQQFLLTYRLFDKEATLWDTTTFKPIIDRFLLPGRIMAFNENGKLALLSDRNELSIRTFTDFTPEGLRKRACNIANRNLTADEWKKYIGKLLPWQPYQPVCQ